jgi:hypothetical protein
VTENKPVANDNGVGAGAEEDTQKRLEESLKTMGFFVTQPRKYNATQAQIDMDAINATIDKLKVGKHFFSAWWQLLLQ